MGTQTLNIWAIIPVKPFVGAKSRLAATLGPVERVKLSHDLFHRTLTTMGAVEGLATTLVVSPDPEVHAVAGRAGVATLLENEPGELNRALTLAAAHARGHGAEAMIVVPVDLPLARPADIRSAVALLEAVGTGRAVLVAPDRHRTGTNLLALRPVDAIPFQFGPYSYARHQAAALARGIPFHAVDNPRLALDVDKPADLALARLA
jgi:2-phospho-L-lactate guanylyltransferase